MKEGGEDGERGGMGGEDERMDGECADILILFFRYRVTLITTHIDLCEKKFKGKTSAMGFRVASFLKKGCVYAFGMLFLVEFFLGKIM